VRLYLSTVVLTLAWFALANAVTSGAVRIAFKGMRRRGGLDAPALLALRLLPLTAAALFAFVLLLPTHWSAESRDGSESFGLLLYALAGSSVVLFALSASRTATALRACRELRRRWSRGAGAATDAAVPGMSLAGIVRTRVLVGRPVREALSAEELEVALAHEHAHQRSRDNLKRFAMFAAPDVLRFTATGREIERLWNAETECRADAAAVGGDSARAAHLASALLKVARLAGASTHGQSSPLWSSFYQRELLERRVRRLVAGTSRPAVGSRFLALVLPLLTLSVCVAWIAGLPLAVHEMTEALVRLVP
jgi:hypothetical protein